MPEVVMIRPNLSMRVAMIYEKRIIKYLFYSMFLVFVVIVATEKYYLKTFNWFIRYSLMTD